MKSINSASGDSLATKTAWHYSQPAIVLHWAVALLLVAMPAVGWYMMAIEDDPGSVWYFDLHKSFGLVLAALVAVRIMWRLSHRVGALPATLPVWQVRLAHWTQFLLYMLMVLMLVTGYLGASYSKKGVKFFGIDTPHWALPNHALAEQFYGIHSVAIWMLVALVALHVAGGLKHLLINRDAVFQRMWFWPSRDQNNCAERKR
jgi:cytochrome b561